MVGPRLCFRFVVVLRSWVFKFYPCVHEFSHSSLATRGRTDPYVKKQAHSVTSKGGGGGGTWALREQLLS